MERGDHKSILLNVDAVLQGIGSANLPGGIDTGRTHLEFLPWGVVGGEMSGKLLRPNWGFKERRGLVGLQVAAFAVPDKKFFIRFDTEISHAERPEYKVVV